MGANGLASQSQRTHAADPLFLPGPSQSMSQRMSQQEALEAAGMDDVDLEAMMEDAEAEIFDDLGLDDDDDEDHAPADWSDVGGERFAAGLNAAHMSTPRDAFRPHAESQTLRSVPSQRVPSPVRPPSGQPPQRRSASPVKPPPPPPPQRRSTSPTKAVVDNPAQRAPPRGRSEAPSRDRSGSRSRSRPRSDEELGNDVDDDVPGFGPTQAGGNHSTGRQVGAQLEPLLTRQFESFFEDD
jgi:hypothetical protein